MTSPTSFFPLSLLDSGDCRGFMQKPSGFQHGEKSKRNCIHQRLAELDNEIETGRRKLEELLG